MKIYLPDHKPKRHAGDYRVGLLRQQTIENSVGPIKAHQQNIKIEKDKLRQSGIISQDKNTKHITGGLQTEIHFQGIKRIVRTFRDKSKSVTEER